ncbi:MAG: DsrE family protein [Methanomassiliicoccales archaeon]|nr:DsrE family protein [Methanomassiliicoccales archaeon]
MRTCILLMRTSSSEEDSGRLFGLIRRAVGSDIAIYLLGDGVLLARKGQKGYHADGINEALNKGAKVFACSRDLRARGILSGEIEAGIEATDDLEGVFIEDSMEKAGRVFSW